MRRIGAESLDNCRIVGAACALTCHCDRCLDTTKLEEQLRVECELRHAHRPRDSFASALVPLALPVPALECLREGGLDLRPESPPLGQLPCDLALGVDGMHEFGKAHTCTDEATGALERLFVLAHVAQDGREHLRTLTVDHGREPSSRSDFVPEYRRRCAGLGGAAHVAQQRQVIAIGELDLVEANSLAKADSKD